METGAIKEEVVVIGVVEVEAGAAEKMVAGVAEMMEEEEGGVTEVVGAEVVMEEGEVREEVHHDKRSLESHQQVRNRVMINVWFQKKSIPTPQKVIENS